MQFMLAIASTYNLVFNAIHVGSKAHPLTFKEADPVKAEAVRVFGVEDDPLLRTLLSTKFDLSAMTYDFSEDGRQVIDRIRSFKPTIVLLDIMIGAVNGLDILEEIRLEADLRKLPVIVFSNQDSDEERRRAADLDASAYLVKATTDLSDLVKMLANYSTK
jgi:DNA-binding response OmpR family regulator